MDARPARRRTTSSLLRLGRLGLIARTLVMELDGVVIGDLYLHVEDAWTQAEVADRAGA